jgi:hypothetical protein
LIFLALIVLSQAFSAGYPSCSADEDESQIFKRADHTFAALL